MFTLTRMQNATGFGRRIVVATFGSLGDLHPYLALALGLRVRGHDVVVATGNCYREHIEALGLGFAAVRPDSDWVTDPKMMRWFSHPRWGLIRVLRRVASLARQPYGHAAGGCSRRTRPAGRRSAGGL